MKKFLSALSIAVILASCAATSGDEATKRKQLQKYKQELHELEQKIVQLESELSETTVEEVINVKVTPVEFQKFEHFFEVSGNVEAEQDVNVSPESSGVIEEVLISEGMDVKKGQVLARLNCDALKRSLDELKINLELANTTYKRQKNLWDQNIGSEIQFLQVKTNKESLEKRIEGLQAQIDMAVVKSPINGVIDILYQKKGHIGSPQVPFAKVLNISKVKIYADIAESYLTKVKHGDMVKIKFPSLDKEIESPIYRIGNTIDKNNRTFRVRINLNNPGGIIKPNIVSIIEFCDYASDQAVVVPALLIKEDFNGHYTYISELKDGKNYAKKIYVTPGVSNNNLTEVAAGLDKGMKVITEGFNQVIDGSLINL